MSGAAIIIFKSLALTSTLVAIGTIVLGQDYFGLFVPSLQNESDIQEDGDDDERRTILVRVVYAILFLFVSLTGIIGNSLVIVLIIMDPALQIKSQSTNLFIMNLAITDLITSSYVTLPAAFNIIFDETPFHPIICKFFCFCNVMIIQTTYMSVLVISFDRFLGVVGWSLHYPQWVTERKMLIDLGCVWFHSTVSALSLTALSLTALPTFVVYDFWAGICDVNWVGERAAELGTLIHGTINFVVPTVLMVFLNVSIVYMPKSKGQVGSLESKGSKVNSRILVSMVIVIVSYILLNCPTGVIRMTKVSLSDKITFPNWATKAWQVLTLSASFVNPLIYGLFRKDFRIAFNKIRQSI